MSWLTSQEKNVYHVGGLMANMTPTDNVQSDRKAFEGKKWPVCPVPINKKPFSTDAPDEYDSFVGRRCLLL